MKEDFNVTSMSRIYYTEVHLKELRSQEHDSSVLADKFGIRVDHVIYDQNSMPFGVRFSGPRYMLRNLLAVLWQADPKNHVGFDPQTIDDRIHYKVQEVTHGRII